MPNTRIPSAAYRSAVERLVGILFWKLPAFQRDEKFNYLSAASFPPELTEAELDKLHDRLFPKMKANASAKDY
jgi:hypothetical protein